MEEQLITKILQILNKEKITIKGNVLSIGKQKITISSKGGRTSPRPPIQLR